MEGWRNHVEMKLHYITVDMKRRFPKASEEELTEHLERADVLFAAMKVIKQLEEELETLRKRYIWFMTGETDGKATLADLGEYKEKDIVVDNPKVKVSRIEEDSMAGQLSRGPELDKSRELVRDFE